MQQICAGIIATLAEERDARSAHMKYSSAEAAAAPALVSKPLQMQPFQAKRQAHFVSAEGLAAAIATIPQLPTSKPGMPSPTACKLEPLSFIGTGTAAPGASMAAAWEAATDHVPWQLHHAPAGYKDAHGMSAATAYSLPLHRPPAPAVSHSSSQDDAVAYWAEETVPPMSLRAPALATSSGQLPAQKALQGPSLLVASALSGVLRDPVLEPSSAVPLPPSVAPSTSTAMPDSIMELVGVVNSQMGQQRC